MRLDRDGRYANFPWGPLVRSEIESWQPQGLPERFSDVRDRRPAKAARERLVRRARRPATVVAAMICVCLLAYVLGTAQPGMPGGLRVDVQDQVPASPRHAVMVQPAKPPPRATPGAPRRADGAVGSVEPSVSPVSAVCTGPACL